MNRVQNSRIFFERERRSIFERKVWSECKNGDREWEEMLKSFVASHARITLTALRAFRKRPKTTVLQSKK